MATPRRLPPSVVARIESHIPTSVHRVHVRPPTLTGDHALPSNHTPQSNMHDRPESLDFKEKRFRATRSPFPAKFVANLQTVQNPSELLPLIRQSLQSDEPRNATQNSLAFIEAITTSLSSVPSSSSSSSSSFSPSLQSAQTAFDELVDVYLSDTKLAKQLWYLLRRVQDPSIISSSVKVKLAHAVVRHPEVYEAMFRHTFTLKDPDHPLRDPLVHRLTRTLLNWKVSGEEVSKFYLEEAAVQEKQQRGSTRDWCLSIWNSIILQLDHRSAMRLLGLFREAVKHRYEGREPGSISPTGIRNIIEPYSSFMRIWSSTRLLSEDKRPIQMNSTIPSILARDLMTLIGGELRLTTHFLNDWMNAERIAQNHETVEMIWSLLDVNPRPVPSLIAPTLAHQIPKQPQPNEKSWRIYMKTQKSLSPTSASLRKDIRQMMEVIPIADMRTGFLDEILSSICHNSPPDIPLLLCLLRLYDWDPHQLTGPPPDKRTINVAAAGLLRLWQCTGQSFDQLLIPHLAREVRDVTANYQRSKAGIFAREWDLMTRTLTQMIPTEEFDLFDHEQLQLPLGKHVPSGQHVSSSAQISSQEDNYQDDDFEIQAGPLTPAHVLLRPITVLVERAIRLVLSERIHSDGEIDRAFEMLVKKVYDEVIPKRTVGWLKDGDRWRRVQEEDDDVGPMGEVEGKGLSGP